MTGSQGISRRQVLTIAAGAAGASVTGAAAVIGTSTPAQAAKVFAVSYEKHAEKNGYTLDHSDGTYLIGKSGKPVLLSPYGQHTELLVQDIKLLLGK